MFFSFQEHFSFFLLLVVSAPSERGHSHEIVDLCVRGKWKIVFCYDKNGFSFVCFPFLVVLLPLLTKSDNLSLGILGEKDRDEIQILRSQSRTAFCLNSPVRCSRASSSSWICAALISYCFRTCRSSCLNGWQKAAIGCYYIMDAALGTKFWKIR